MATANSRLKIDFGFDSYSTSNVEGNFNVSGNVTIGGTVLSSITTAGDLIPVNDGTGFGNNTNRWTILANSGNFTNTLTVSGATSLQDTLTVTKTLNSGNVTITGFANASGNINSSSFSIGSSLIANTTGLYHTGTINSASFSTSGLLANSTALVSTSNTILLGNSTGRFVISANTGNFSSELTVSGNTTLSGNATLNGTLQAISGNVNFDSGTLFVDSLNNRVGIGKTNPNAGLDISGSANVSTSVNSALFTVGSDFIANTSGAYHTGSVNAASHTVGSNFVANSSTVTHDGIVNLTSATSTLRIGNSSVNTFVNSSVVATSTGNFSTGANVGSNVNLTTSGISIGNSTVNVFSNSNSITVSGTSYTVNVNSSGFSVGSFSVNTSILSVNTGNFVEGANVGANVRLTTADINIGNSTVNVFANSILIKISNNSSTANLSPLDLKIGSAVVNSSVLTIGTGNFSTGANVGSNVNLTTTGIQIGNSSVNTQVNSSVFSTGTGNFSLAANVGANVKLTTVILSIGNSTVNSTVNSTIVQTGGLTINSVFTANGSAGTNGYSLLSNGSSGSPYWYKIGDTVDDTTTDGSRYLLFANQTSGLLSNAYVSSTKLTYNPSTGTLTSTIVSASSDERLKTNINTITNPLSYISSLRGVSFERIDSNIFDYGVIAQEIEKVVPSIVHQDRDGYKSVSYNSIIGFLIEAVKELKQEIEELKNVNSK